MPYIYTLVLGDQKYSNTLLTFPTPLITPPDTRTYFIMAVLRFWGRGRKKRQKLQRGYKSFVFADLVRAAALALAGLSVPASGTDPWPCQLLIPLSSFFCCFLKAAWIHGYHSSESFAEAHGADVMQPSPVMECRHCGDEALHDLMLLYLCPDCHCSTVCSGADRKKLSYQNGIARIERC